LKYRGSDVRFRGGSPQDEYTEALFAAALGRNWEFGKFATA